MTIQDLSRSYVHGSTAPEQDRLRLLNELTNPQFISFLPMYGVKNVLEVGCGLGILLNQLAAIYPNVDFQGIEYSEEHFKSACAKGFLPNVKLIQGDAHHLPFEGNQFDLIYCRYVLEHLQSPSTALSEIYRTLRPGGTFACQENDDAMTVYDPAKLHLESVWVKFIQLQSLHGGDGLIGRKLFGLFKRAGFREISLSLQPQLHWYDEPGYEMWLNNMKGILNASRHDILESNLVSKQEFEMAFLELEELKNDPFGSALFHWNRASGVK